jgi:peptidyl-prolyl cis-trans isomerase B (cyclophilin B)
MTDRKKTSILHISASLIAAMAALFFLASASANHHAEKSDKQSTSKPTPVKAKEMVTLKTNMGDIQLELDGENAPHTVANFIQYAKEGHYNGVIFHRVIPNFMIQGGGFDVGMQEKKTRGPVPNEANNGLKNDKYTLAMARTSDPHSASAQFFINTKDNDFLNFKSETSSGWGYAVFGKVTTGTEIVDAIEKVATGQMGPYGDVPRESVIIESVEVSED